MAARINATKKPPAKKSATSTASPTAAPVLGRGGDFEILRLTSTPAGAEDMVPLFEIDGVEYSIPRKPRANLALQYLRVLEERGPELASVFILRSMLGDAGYKALSDCDSLTEDHLVWILETLQGLVMGTQEAPKG